MIDLILSGGSGTRFWPLSRIKLPKQFVRLLNNQSLFQLTVNKNASVCNQTLKPAALRLNNVQLPQRNISVS